MKRFTRAIVNRGAWLVLAVLLTDALLVYRSLGTISQANGLVDRRRQAVADLDDSLSLLKDAETGQRGYLLTGRDDDLGPFASAETGVQKSLVELKSLTAKHRGQQALIDELGRLARERLGELQKSVALRREGNVGESLKIALGDRGKEVMRKARKVASAIRAEEDRLLTERTTASQSAVWSTVYNFSLTTGLSVLLIVGIFSLQRREAAERELAAAAIRKSEAWLSTTLNSVGDALIATDERGNIRFMNPVAEALTGWPQEIAAGRPMHEVLRVIDQDTRQPVESHVSRVIREGAVVGLANQTVLVSMGGKETPIEDRASAIRNEQGGVAGVVTVFRDVTEARRAERALRQSEARKAAILQASLDAIITIDHEGKVVEFNPGAERTFGYRRDEAIGREMCELVIPPSQREAHRKGMAHYHATGEGPVLGRRVELTGMRADGSEFPVEAAITAIATDGPTMFTAYLRDITERNRSEQAIVEQGRLAAFGRDIGLVLTATTSLDVMLARAAEETVRHLDGAFARIWTTDEAGDVLELKASAGMYTHLDGPHAHVPVGQFKIGRIAQERRPHLTNSVIGDPQVPAQDWARREGMVSFAGLPLIVEDRLVGVWAMFARRPLSEATIRAMESVANGIAVGIERKRFEEALAESEAWLSTTLMSIGDAVIVTDAQGRVHLMNTVAEGLTGWTRREAAGLPMEEVFQILNERSRQPVENPVGRVLREGMIVGLANHTVLIARDGTETAIEDSAAPIRDPHGNLFGVVMVFRDTTAQRRHEKELRQSEERFRQLADAMPQIVWAARPDGFLDYYNDRWYSFTGMTRGVGGDPSWEPVIHPDDLAATRDAWYHSVRTGEPFQVECRFLDANTGEYRWHLGRALPVRDEAGHVAQWFGTSTDIDDRKRAEGRLREAEERLRLVVESVKDYAIFSTDPTGTVVSWNAGAERIFGYAGGEILGRNIALLFTPEDREAGLPGEELTHAFETGHAEAERWHLRKDGTRFFAGGVVTPIRDQAGAVRGFTKVARDITERKRFEEELKSTKAEAEEANRAKDRFLAVLSHELRTPLNPILLAVTSMLERPTPPDQVRPNLEMIRQNVNLQARLIDDLLDVMRIVRGKMPLHWEVADCHGLVRQAIQICQSEVFGKELRLNLDLAATEHHLNVDPARFQQVIWNLVKNAVKFTPSGGSIAIRTYNRPGDGVNQLVIEVSDTGIGIEPNILPVIFDPFQQGETKITRKFGGLGLGLAICRGVVDSHGGSLTAESPGLDKGTTFTIVLKTIPSPATTPGGSADDSPSSPPLAPPSLKLLVVEDEPATRRLMARLLKGLGHEITTAGTIGEAVKAVEATGHETFDLIISDIGLPDGSGLDLMRRVVASRGKIPSIALTGYGMEEDIRRSREAGFTAHMTKPIDFTKLEAMIRQVAPSGT